MSLLLTNDVSKFVKNTVHSFSLYSFNREEPIPISTNKNLICTKFEHFYQNLLNEIKELPEANLYTVKTKMRNTCEKYSKIKVPWKHRETFINLSNNQNIVIMKHNNGGGVVIMDINKYFDAYLALLSSQHFVKSNQDPIATAKTKLNEFYKKSNKTCQKKYIKSVIQQRRHRRSFMEPQRFIRCNQIKALKNFFYDQ